MIRPVLAAWAAVMICAAVIVCAPASAQAPGTAAGSGATDFNALIDQDVAANYYSQAQADELKAEYEAAQERIQASMDKAGASVDKTVSLLQSGDPTASNQVQSMMSNGKLTQVGSTPAEIHDQAEGIYGTLYQGVQTTQAVLDDVAPAVQDYLNEVDGLIAKRAQLIGQNPNVPAAVKSNVQREASQVHDVVANSFDTAYSKLKFKIQTIQGQLESNKDQIVDAIDATMTQMKDQYGTQVSNWPAAPTKTTPTPANQPPQQQTVASNQPAPTPSNATHTTNTPGTVPSNQPDPALSATRNQTGNNQTGNNGSGNGGTGQQGNTGNGNNQNSNSNASNGAAAAAQAAQTQANKPPPKNPLDQLNKTPPPRPDMPIATPYQPPNGLPTSPGYVYNAPPPPPGSTGEGGVITPETPPAPPNTAPVFAPSNKSTNDLPPPVLDLPPMEGLPPPPPSPQPKPNIPGQNPNAQTTAATDPALDAYRNNPNGRPDPDSSGQDSQGPPPPSQSGDSTGNASSSAAIGSAAAAAAAYASSSVQDSTVPQPPPTAKPSDPNATPPEITDMLKNLPKGNLHIVEGDDMGTDTLGSIQLPSLSDFSANLMQSGDYGDTMMTATLLPIYAGYDLNANPGDAMRSLDLQVETPSSVMTVPSNQILVPSSLVNMPSNQILVPSDVMTVPSTQVQMPSMVAGDPLSDMTGEPDPVLCGH